MCKPGESDYSPAYAPELNPVEYIWNLGEGVIQALKRMRRRKRLVVAF